MTRAAIVRAANEWDRRQACATCGERCAPFKCAWRCEVPTRVYPHLIEVGEFILTPNSKKLAPVTYVNVIREAETKRVLSVDITIEYRHGRRKPPYPRFTYWRAPGGALEVLRPGVCGARCCEAHAREVGDGVHYCKAHWRAWMEASE